MTWHVFGWPNWIFPKFGKFIHLYLRHPDMYSNFKNITIESIYCSNIWRNYFSFWCNFGIFLNFFSIVTYMQQHAIKFPEFSYNCNIYATTCNKVSWSPKLCIRNRDQDYSKRRCMAVEFATHYLYIFDTWWRFFYYWSNWARELHVNISLILAQLCMGKSRAQLERVHIFHWCMRNFARVQRSKDEKARYLAANIYNKYGKLALYSAAPS